MDSTFDVIVVGAGLSGLSSAHFLNKLRPGLRLVVLERDGRLGGAVKSFKEQGFQGEWGPHGFLDNTAESQELLHDTGLYDAVQRAPLGDFYRYVCHQGHLQRLPQSLKAVLTTPLVSFAGKLRVLADLWKVPKSGYQTLEEWVRYRFGEGILPLVDAAVTGSFAGDYTKLCVDCVLPGTRKIEKEAGSLIRGLIRQKKQAAERKKGMRLPAMLNFPEGMERFLRTLGEGCDVRLNCGAQAVRRLDDIWEVTSEGGTFRAKALVVALPVNAAFKLLSPLGAPPVKEIPVARIINVVMGFTESAKIPYGFGYLAPERERRFTMGAMFTSHMFPDRAPEGHVVLEALVGGRRHPERLRLDDEEIIRRVYEDTRQLIELPEPPVFTKVLRPTSGIPQLEMDHPKVQKWRQGLELKERGLAICGFGWDGIGMNDMVKSAKKAARLLIEGDSGPEERAKIKPVYF